MAVAGIHALRRPLAVARAAERVDLRYTDNGDGT
jgi:hypothetical protein